MIDADELARKGQVEVVVKIAGDHQPMPPAHAEGVPFRPVEFENLTATPYIDESRNRPRIAWSFRASGMHAPGAATPTRAGQKQPAGDGKAA